MQYLFCYYEDTVEQQHNYLLSEYFECQDVPFLKKTIFTHATIAITKCNNV